MIIYSLFVCLHAVAFFCVNELCKMQELKQGWKQGRGHGGGVHDQGLICKKGSSIVRCVMLQSSFLTEQLLVSSTYNERW